LFAVKRDGREKSEERKLEMANYVSLSRGMSPQ